MNAKVLKNVGLMFVVSLLLVLFGALVANAGSPPQELPAMPDNVVEFKAIREVVCHDQPGINAAESLTATKGLTLTGDLLFYDENGGIWFRQGTVGNNYGWVSAENWCPILANGIHNFSFNDKQRPMLAEMIQTVQDDEVQRLIGWTRVRDIPSEGFLLLANADGIKSRFGYIKGNPLQLTWTGTATTTIQFSTGLTRTITGTETLEPNRFSFWFTVTDGQAVLKSKGDSGKVVENTQFFWSGEPQGVDLDQVVTGGTFHQIRGGNTGGSLLRILAPWVIALGLAAIGAAFFLPRFRRVHLRI